MILEGLVNSTVVGGKQLGFKFVKEEQMDSPESFAEAVYNMHLPLYDNNQIEKLNTFLENNGQKPFKVMNAGEIAYRKSLQKKVLDVFSKNNYSKIKYGSHRTTDFGERYFVDSIMQTTPDKKADLEYNQRITDLIKRANNGDFAPDSEASKTEDTEALDQLAKDKEDFIQLHRDHLASIKFLDIERLALEDITDEELAEHAAEYFKVGLVGGQFDNIRLNFEKWGIEDEECSKIMSDYNASADYCSYIKQRLDKMYSSGYAYYEPSSAPETRTFLEEYDHVVPVKNSFLQVIENQKNINGFALSAEVNTISNAFQKLGVNRDKLKIKVPGDKNGEEFVDYDLLVNRLGNKSEFILIDSDHPELEMKFKLSQDLPYTRLQMIKDHDAIKNAAVPEMPKSVSFFGKIADFFTNLRTGHKPRQEAYQKQLDKRNYILSSKELIKQFDDNIKKLADVKKQELLNDQNSKDKSKNQPEAVIAKAKEEPAPKEEVKEVPQDPEEEAKKRYQENIAKKSLINRQIDSRDRLVHDAYKKKSKYSDEVERYDRVKDVRDRLYASYLLNKDGSHLVDMKKCVAELFYIAGVEQRLTDSMKEGNFDEIYDQLSDSFEEKNMKEGIEDIYNNEYFNAYFAKMDPIDFNKLGTSVIEPDGSVAEDDLYAEHRNDSLEPIRKELDKFTEFIQKSIDQPEKTEQLKNPEANIVAGP